MESQSQSGRALAYKLGGFESTASLRIAYSLPNTKAATYLAVLQLGFTTVSIDRRDLPAVRQCPTLEDLKTLHAGFCRAILRSDSVLIPVKSAGKGPTPASQKVKVSLSWADPQDSEKIQSESTITVPVSQLQMVEGQLFVPRWLVRKTLNNRTRATVTNANLPAVVSLYRTPEGTYFCDRRRYSPTLVDFYRIETKHCSDLAEVDAFFGHGWRSKHNVITPTPNRREGEWK